MYSFFLHLRKKINIRILRKMALQDVQSIFSIAESIAVIVGLISVCVTYKQWRGQKTNRQIQYLKDFSSSIMENSDMASFINMIEHEDSIGYKDGKFVSNEHERIVDHALCYLSNYVALIESELVNEKDFQFARYVLKHTLKNKEIQSYLKFLEGVVDGNRNAHPYKQLLEYEDK